MTLPQTKAAPRKKSSFSGGDSASAEGIEDTVCGTGGIDLSSGGQVCAIVGVDVLTISVCVPRLASTFGTVAGKR